MVGLPKISVGGGGNPGQSGDASSAGDSSRYDAIKSYQDGRTIDDVNASMAPNSGAASTTNNSRSVDVYVWNRDLPSVGHAMVTDHNSTLVVVSQFPMNKEGNEGTYRLGQGFNQTLTYQQTFDAEGRQPSTVYVVQLNNYTGALNQAATEQGREFWNWRVRSGEIGNR
jgi:hypothetical protein